LNILNRMPPVTPTQDTQSSNLREVRHCPTCGSVLIGTPVLVCGECGHERPLRCFYYQASDGRYVAECIDLDILSDGETPEQAIGGLQEAMHGFLRVAFDGGSKEGLLLRKSPLSHRLHYHWCQWRDRLRGLRSHKAGETCFHEFREGRLSHCTR
jgi:predicted RNase H-like HicB family nuclease